MGGREKKEEGKKKREKDEGSGNAVFTPLLSPLPPPFPSRQSDRLQTIIGKANLHIGVYSLTQFIKMSSISVRAIAVLELT